MRILPVSCLLLSLVPGGAALADHDDGDDVKEYAYLLRFDAKELSAFAGYVVVDGSDMDTRFQVSPRIGGAASPVDVALAYSGSIPVTIEAIPGRDLLAKAEAWARGEAARSPDHVLWMDPEVLKRFEAAFGGEAHRLSYTRSPLLSGLLGLAACHMHFLKGPRDGLARVVEHVALRYDSPRSARIVPIRYVLEYRDGSRTELSPEKAAALSAADLRSLLQAKGKTVTRSGLSPERLWNLGAPSFAAAMLVGLAFRRRSAG